MSRSVLTFASLLGLSAALAAATPQLEVREEATVLGAREAIFSTSEPPLEISGDTLAVGFRFADGAQQDEGEVVVYRRSGSGGWAVEDTLRAPLTQGGAQFGTAIALSGETLAVSAPREDHSGILTAGAVYVFVRSGTAWSLEERIQLTTPLSGDSFGEQLALDGEVLVVGTPNEGSILGIPEGTTRVYRRSAGVWTQEALLLSPTGEAGDQFGFRLAVSGDTLIASSFEGYSTGGGVAFVYTLAGGFWTLQQELRASDASPFFYFASSLDLQGDRAVISNRRGSVYVFSRSGSVWTEDVRLTPPAVAALAPFISIPSIIALEGEVIAQGLALDDTAGFTSGSAVLWRFDGADWNVGATIFRGEGQATERFATAVAIDTDRCAFLNQYSDDCTIFTYRPEEFQTACYGDEAAAASGCTPCPCGNAALGGTFGGCSNSRGRFARLLASGIPSVSNDSLTLDLLGASTNTFALLFAGDMLLPAAAACPPGSGVQSVTVLDGLRCVGQGPAILRLGTRATNAAGESASSWGQGGLIASAGSSAGQTLHLQAFYRDTGAGTCGTGQNSTNAVSVPVVP